MTIWATSCKYSIFNDYVIIIMMGKTILVCSKKIFIDSIATKIYYLY